MILAYLLVIFTSGRLCAQKNSSAETFTTTGQVLDGEGHAVDAVSVFNSRNKKGTVTDATGNFKIDARQGDVLSFSKVGYQEQIATVISAAMAPVHIQSATKALDEVVVVGYGSQKQVNLTGAVDQVSGKVMADRPITRIAQGLQGEIAGLNVVTTTAGGAPNATQTINIRGYTGLGVTGGPLVVIDGVQGGDINSVNPADVESISVLKDAASAAIYGSSAPYGVILINTKKGRKNAPPSITYTNNIAFAQPIGLPKMVNSLDFAKIYNEAFTNAGRGLAFTDDVIQRMKDYQSGKISTETVPTKTGADAWGSWFEGNANHDWFKVYFKDFATSQQHNLGINGGGNNSTYYVGLGYNDHSGLYNYGNDDYKRYSVRANLSSTVTNWMTIGLRSMLARSINNTPNTYAGRTGGNYMHQIARKFPNVALKNPDGGYSDPGDILLMKNGGRVIQTEDDAIVTGEVNLKPAKGWEIVSNYTFDGIFNNQSSQVKTLYTKLPSGTLSPMSGSTPNSFSRNSNRNEHTIANLYSSYEKSFGNHNMKLLAGFVRELTTYTAFGASNNNLYSDDIPSLNTTYNPTATISDENRELAVQGYFGRFNYNFKEKYLVEFNGRYDGTSRFLKDVRWKFYPGVSAGWNIDKEGFWKGGVAKTIDALKIRGSYGSQGDQSFLGVASVSTWYPFYPSLATSAPTSNNWLFGTSQQASVGLPPLVNNELTWVTTTSYDLGLDASLLNHRLNVRYDWYVRNAKDFAGPSVVLPAVLGTGVPQANNTTIQTKGYEVTVQWRDHIGKVGYGIRATLSDYTGKVVKYPNPTKLLSTWYAGQKMGEIWGYSSDGLYNNKNLGQALPAQFWTGRWQEGDVHYIDRDKSGRIDYGANTATNSGDMHVIGNNTPRYQFGFGIDLNWKNFDFNAFAQGVAKRDAFINSNYFWGMQSSEFQSSPFTAQINNTWTTYHPSGYFARPYMNTEIAKNQQVTDRYLQNAAYLRIKNVQLGYTLPIRLSSAAYIKRARIFAGVENLATFTRLIKTMDPELSISDGKIYPLQRSFSCGVNVTF
ncbi:SusC/RagA family TonB-linked outer membrane protein [Deminuibacter soli]|nr:SusC/RagA family TonB-linked outer membrane protein [Deminuibacter soli]